jgi:hypothetical protein
MAKLVALKDLNKVLETITNQFHAEHVKLMAMTTLRRVPVDSGQARNSISISQKYPIAHIGAASLSASEAIAFINRAKPNINSPSFVVAGAEYSGLLEFGSSDKAPQGFMRNTVQEASSHANRAAKRLKE